MLQPEFPDARVATMRRTLDTRLDESSPPTPDFVCRRLLNTVAAPKNARRVDDEVWIAFTPNFPRKRRLSRGSFSSSLPTGSLGASDVNNNDGVRPSSFNT